MNKSLIQFLKNKYKEKNQPLPNWLKILDSRIPLPYLHLFIDIGFIRIRTALMYYSFENQYTIWICLDCRIFGKGFEFRLYRPD